MQLFHATKTLALVTLSLSLLAACDRPVAPKPEVPPPAADAPAAPAGGSPAPAPATAPTAVPAPQAGQLLWLEPTALSACGTGKDVVTVNWDVTSRPEIKDIKIMVMETKGPEGLFALTGSKGSKPTGEWMAPGKTIVMRNAADEAELARVTVGSIPCAQ